MIPPPVVRRTKVAGIRCVPMPHTIPDHFLHIMAEKFQLLADPTRLAIIRALLNKERNVGEIVRETGQGQANVSKHLRLLAQSGMLSRRREGLKIYYAVRDPIVSKLCALVCSTLAREFAERPAKRRTTRAK